MRSSRIIIFTCLFTLASTIGCQKTLSLSEYKTWLYSPDSGLTDSVSRNGRTYYFTILPSTYRALNKSKTRVDDRVTGILRVVGHDRQTDVTMDGVVSMEQHTNRVADLSFHVKDLTKITVNGRQTKAVGSMMPHAQGIRPYASVYLTFSESETTVSQAGSCAITFDDEVFGEGRMEWRFETADLLNQPHIVDKR